MNENMNMDMNMGTPYVQTQQAPQKKSSGGGLVWLVLVVVGIILLVIGVIIYNVNDRDKYFKLKDIHQTFNSETVTKVDMDIPFGDLNITKSNDKMIHIDAENIPDEFDAKVEGTTFKTSCVRKRIGFITMPSFHLWGDNNATLNIALPEKVYASFILNMGAGETTASDIECGKFKIDCGAGEVTFTDVTCDNGEIDCGAGQVNINDMDCKEKLDIDGGAGDINVINSTLGGLDLDQGVGQFEFKGTINGNIDADGGVGEMTFRLTNPETDFSKNGGKYKMDIDHGIGSVDVYYNER